MGPHRKSGQDWASDLTDRIDQVVAKVRSQTTDRLVRIARLVVYGLVAVVMGGMALVLVVIGLVRLVDVVVPQEVWLTYLILGGVFTGAGLFCWSKKERPPEEDG